MFLRWKHRKAIVPRRPYSKQTSACWSAVLVESRRVDGKPRQFVVQHLGSIAEDMRAHIYPQVAFWRKVLPKLDARQLTDTQRADMETTLCRIVPRPTPEETAEIEAELAARASRQQERQARTNGALRGA